MWPKCLNKLHMPNSIEYLVMLNTFTAAAGGRAKIAAQLQLRAGRWPDWRLGAIKGFAKDALALSLSLSLSRSLAAPWASAGVPSQLGRSLSPSLSLPLLVSVWWACVGWDCKINDKTIKCEI